MYRYGDTFFGKVASKKYTDMYCYVCTYVCIYTYIYNTYKRIDMGVPGSEMWPRTRGLNPCRLFCRYRPLYRRGPGYTVVPSGSLCVYYEREFIERERIQMERV